MAKPKIKLSDSYKKPYLAAGRIIRELSELSADGRGIAMKMVSEYKFEEPEAGQSAEDRTGDLFEAGT